MRTPQLGQDEEPCRWSAMSSDILISDTQQPVGQAEREEQKAALSMPRFRVFCPALKAHWEDTGQAGVGLDPCCLPQEV